MASEKILEKRLKSEVEKLGGLCLKYHNSFDTSYPDRIVLMPGGKTVWIEIKSSGEKLEKLQEFRIRSMEALGHRTEVIDTYTKLENFLNEFRA